VIGFCFYIADSGVCDISTDCFYSYGGIIRMGARGVGGRIYSFVKKLGYPGYKNTFDKILYPWL